jgi:hypothetical protein
MNITNKIFTLPFYIPSLILLASCGGGGSSGVEKDPNSNISNGKIGDFTFNGSGQVIFPNAICPKVILQLSGTGTVNKINGQYHVTMQRNKSFTTASPCDSNTFLTVTDTAPLTCTVGDEVLTCTSTNDAYNDKFSWKLKTGFGIFDQSYHFASSTGLQLGDVFGDITPTNWLGIINK